ncbi:hypothetical protein GCM10007424_26090 [Flavobacterium suaedae]|uniref:Pentapeptide repeat-containing protein n=1 Tax=Flavobacterium suaedae TaxID=1767027 RepID=A0ABQ1K174_9FLAO|nr:hypothetical protein [Flavobacterium suaedae]GGB84823.1 hypothetical protein GCM10007424_26090 [Flavobacterium suaedae]
MIVIDENTFLRLLYQNQKEFEGYDIRIENPITVDLNLASSELVFQRVFFKGEKITFFSNSNKRMDKSYIIFLNTHFSNNNTVFNNIAIEQLIFSEVSSDSPINIIGLDINTLEIEETILNKLFNSKGNINEILLSNSKFFEGIFFEKLQNHLFEFSKSYCSTFWNLTSHFSKVNIYKSTFISSIDCGYLNCSINEFFFSENMLKTNFYLNMSRFKNTLKFKSVHFDENSLFKINSCDFKGKLYFENSSFVKFHIQSTEFRNYLTFEEVVFSSIDFQDTNFISNTYFDQVLIKNINKCKRKTIRQIKYALQKTDNKIDYNRFKSYELETYYQEIEWKDNFKDKFILSATWFSTGFDHSWIRAMVFTLLSGLLFYCLFLISEDYLNSFEVYKGKEFFSGYFRFLLITDFYNPLIKEREFLTEPLSWLIFILGKIVIAFGIYEMIQAFRKFKA